MTLRRLRVERRILADSIDELRLGGNARTERFALWLGKKTELQVLVSELYIPVYEASSDHFHVGRDEMAHLIAHLRMRNIMIGAQLHTHPAEAFHSAADDHWAIVRHVGALSIVLPEFGRNTTVENFLMDAKIFALSPRNRWTEVLRRDLHDRVEVIG